MSKQEPHKHNHTKLGYIREFGTVSRTNEFIHEVEARTIDRIIVTLTCECKDYIAIDCGSKDEMRTLLARLKEGSNDSSRLNPSPDEGRKHR